MKMPTHFVPIPRFVLASAPILCLMKTSENVWFSSVFRGYKKGNTGKKMG